MADMKLCIVTEGLSDIHLIRLLLSQEAAFEMKYYASQGKVSAVTVARNLLVHEGGPVLLVSDANTLDVERQREYEETTLAAVDSAYPRAHVTMEPFFKVFTFRPEIEVVFFEAPRALEHLLGREVDERTIEEGTARPKRLLQNLCGINESPWVESLIARIDKPMLDLLLEGEQATRLRDTVHSFTPSFAN